MKIKKETEDAITQEFCTLEPGEVFITLKNPDQPRIKITSEYDDDDDDDGDGTAIKDGFIQTCASDEGFYITLQSGIIHRINNKAKIIKIDGEFVY